MAGRRRQSYWDNWEAKRDKDIAEFISSWSWDDVFRAWQARLNELSVHIQPLFETVHVCDPANLHGREPAFSWWPRNSIRILQKEMQRHLDRYPGTRGLIHPSDTRKGEVETIHYLWEQRQDPIGIAAVLISASLFSRIGSSRGHYPRENWPPIYCVQELDKWAHEAWGTRASACGWHYSCTEVIPYENKDHEYKIETLSALVRYIAEEHAALLHGYCPIVIKYQPEPDPFIAKILTEENLRGIN